MIGRAITRRLLAEGYDVRGLGRSERSCRAAFPELDWVVSDLRQMRKVESWLPHLTGVDAIVNASGALQDGGKDDLKAAQGEAISALVKAAEQFGVRCFVQISAPGATPEASTAFLRTKCAGDEAVRGSGLSWTILKPGLVLSETAYGGTGLLRMLAAFPLVQPVFLEDSLVQTVDIADVVEAVQLALDTEALAGGEYDLVEPDTHRLADLILRIRTWLGFSAPLAVVPVPALFAGIIIRLSDWIGMFGWRSPLRSTATTVLADGVTGDGAPFLAATGLQPKSLDATLRRLSATPQERIYARIRLLFPAVAVTLSLFWLLSGLIGFLRLEVATNVISAHFGAELGRLFVLAGGVSDIVVGLLFIWRDTFVLACWLAVGLSLAYLVAATLFVPHLWADPLGPLVKVLPGLVLAPFAAAAMETR